MSDTFVPRALLLIGLAVFPACAAFQSAANTGPCTPADLGKIEARFVAEAVKACSAEGAQSLETCEAYPAIRDKYRAEREAFVRCDQ